MRARQPSTRRKSLPQIWLMTDARFGDRLIAAIRRLPQGSGVIFRHYHLAPAYRRDLFRQVHRVCRQRGHMLIIASDERTAIRWRADGFHGGKKARSTFVHSLPVHNIAELREAARVNADLVFLSPLFTTQSHPDGKPLGRTVFNRLARLARQTPAIALGGMTKQRAQSVKKFAHGWAAIDAFRKTRS